MARWKLFLLLSVLSAGLKAQPVLLQGPSTLVYPSFWHTPFGIHRGTPSLLKMLVGDQATFNNPQGLACTHLLEAGPENDQLTVVGVNSGQCCLIYNSDLTSLKVYGHFGSGDGQFNRPMSVALLPDGRLAVADAGNNRIALLRLEKGEIQWLGSFGTEGAGQGEFENPNGVAFDSQGNIYVSDTGNNRIQIFTPRGEFLNKFGSDPGADNSLLQPQALAVMDHGLPYSCIRENAIFVIDGHHGRVQKFDLQGNFLAQTTGSDLNKLVYFSGLALDCYANVWVVDMSNDQIHKFDHQLEYVDSWGSSGDRDGQFRSPRGIAIYPHYGQVFVSEAQSAQYFWIGADAKNITLSVEQTDQGSNYLRIDFLLTEKATTQAWLENEQGLKVRELLAATVLPQGENAIAWDGKLTDGQKAQAGIYVLKIQVEPTYSSATYYVKQTRQKFRLK